MDVLPAPSRDAGRRKEGTERHQRCLEARRARLFGHILPALLFPGRLPPLWDGVCKPAPDGLPEPALPA